MSASEIYAPAEEEAAFAEIYRAHHQKLLRYCQYRLRDRHEAEDVMQEAFVRAWRSMPTSAYDRNFYPWLRVVAGNLCTDTLRKRSRSELVADLEPGVVDGGMDRISVEEDRVLVRQALARLNDRHREALMMREDEGLTYDQIAARTGATSGTVESLLWRARQALKREFVVIAGREGCMAVVPALLAVAGRLRAATRRAYVRTLRRIPGAHTLQDNPAAHLAVAAIAALTVVGGVAATLGLGRGSSPATQIIQSDAHLAATTHLASGVANKPLAVASHVVAAGGQTLAASAPGESGSASTTVANAAGPAPLRVVSPLVAGRQAQGYAYKAPVQVNAGQFTIGVAPGAVSTYVNSVQQRLGSAHLPASHLP
jgi:RNA polymerase sigma-70 factor (ECF subfamily)